MKITDYPHTLAALQKHLRGAEKVRPSHGGFIRALNKVREEVGIQPIDIDELVLATLGRVEDKINEKAQVGTEARPENGNEPQEHTQTTQEIH